MSLFTDGGVAAPRPARDRCPGSPARPARRTPARENRTASHELERSRAQAGEDRTLEDVVCGAWEDLTAHRATACPVCGGAMLPRRGSGPAVVAASCGGCGAGIS